MNVVARPTPSRADARITFLKCDSTCLASSRSGLR
jgi:hypothetical protein